jgi:hypothetical protein
MLLGSKRELTALTMPTAASPPLEIHTLKSGSTALSNLG